MDLKKKFAVGACAVALTSMMASPAFAGTGTLTVEDLNKRTTTNTEVQSLDGTAQTNEFDIHAYIVDTTKIIKVSLPTSVTVGYKTDGANLFTPGGFVGPNNAKVTNLEGSSDVLHVGIATIDQPTDFFTLVTDANKSMLNVTGVQKASLVAAVAPGTPSAYLKLTADGVGLAIKADMPLSFTSDLADNTNLTDLKTALVANNIVKTQFKVSLTEGQIV